MRSASARARQAYPLDRLGRGQFLRVGGGGRWFGLVQISPGTARGYGCEAKSGQALLDGEKNLSCAIRILSTTVPRDGVVAAGGGGIAADWGPFVSSAKRKDMRDWVSGQSYCAAG